MPIGQDTQSVRESYDEVVLPFSFLFVIHSPIAPGPGDTVADTPGETSTDGKIDDDTVDDEDEDDGTLEDQTGLIADSGTQEDEDY